MKIYVTWIIATTALFPHTIAGTHTPEWINFTSKNGIYSICNVGEYVWIGGTGLTKLHKTTGTMEFYNKAISGLPHNRIFKLAQAPDGNLWIGMYKGGAAKFNGNTWTVYNTKNSGLPDNAVCAIAFDKQKNVWIGTFGGLAMFDGTNWIIYNRENSPLPDDYIRALAIDSFGSIWIGTKIYDRDPELSGPVKFDGTNWTIYEKHYLKHPLDHVCALAIDTDGSIWKGTLIGGLAHTRQFKLIKI